MKPAKIFLILFCTCITLVPAKAQERNEQEKQIFEYISSNDIFSLIEIYPSVKDSLNKAVQSYTEAFMYKCIGNPQASLFYIDETLKEQDKLDDETKIDALLMLADNLMQMQEYNEAANIMAYILEITASFIDEESHKELALIHNRMLKYSNLPKRHFTRPEEDCRIDFKFKKAGRGELIAIPCEINGKAKEAIVDTGCSLSNVSLSFALENDVYMTENTVPLHGIGGTSEGRIGVIKSIQVGNMTYNDVVCVVRSSTPLDSIADVFLGVELMRDAGEFQLLPKEEKIIFPVHHTPLPDTGINMAIIGNVPFIKAHTGNERLVFLFDSGSVDMAMNESYYSRHREKIEATGVRKEIPVGGIGGVSQLDIYNLPNLPLQIGKRTIDVNNVIVHTSHVHQVKNIDTDGDLGVGFIKACNKVTVNFQRAFMEVE